MMNMAMIIVIVVVTYIKTKPKDLYNPTTMHDQPPASLEINSLVPHEQMIGTLYCNA